MIEPAVAFFFLERRRGHERCVAAALACRGVHLGRAEDSGVSCRPDLFGLLIIIKNSIIVSAWRPLLIIGGRQVTTSCHSGAKLADLQTSRMAARKLSAKRQVASIESTITHLISNAAGRARLLPASGST